MWVLVESTITSYVSKMDAITATAEWKELKELAVNATNAVLLDDEVLERHYCEEIRRIGNSMMALYGRSPVVLETLADFTPEVQVAKRLFEEAIQLIDHDGGDSTSPRMSLAELLLDNEGAVEEVAKLIDRVDETRLSSDDRNRLSLLRSKAERQH